MGIDIIIKIASVGLLTAVVGQILKHTGKDEIATLTTLAGLVICLLMVLDMISSLFTTVKTMFEYRKISSCRIGQIPMLARI